MTRNRVLAAAAGAVVLAVGAVTGGSQLLSQGASSFYVSVSGSDSNPCSQSQPCATFQRGYAVASEGDTVLIEPGTYPFQNMDMVTGKAELSDQPDVTIKPDGKFGDVNVQGGITAYGVRHATIQQINVQGPFVAACNDASPTTPEARGQQTYDLTFQNSHASTVRTENAQYLTIASNDIGPSVDANFKIGASGDTGGANCTDAPPDHITVEDNLIHNFRESSTATHAECIFIEGGHNILFQRNIIRSCSVFSFFVKQQLSAGLFGMQGISILNNFIGHPVASAARPSAGGTSLSLSNGTYKDVLIANNSLGGTLQLRTDSTSTAWSNVVVSGNLAQSMGAANACATAGITWVGNAYLSGPKCANDIATGVASGWALDLSPAQIADTTADFPIDYHLLPGAWAIDRATTSIAQDFDQQDRPIGPADDVGADEFGSDGGGGTTTTTTTTTTQPTTTTTTTDTTTTSSTTTTQPPPPVSHCPDQGTSLMLSLITSDPTTVTLGWTPPPGAIGYRFSRQGYVKPSGAQKYPNSWNGVLAQVTFTKSDWYCVEALAVNKEGGYP